MDWTPLPEGIFTGIDWSEPGATTGFDPYLVWAEADRFGGYEKPDGKRKGKRKIPKRLPLLLELRPGRTIEQLRDASDEDWLHIPAVYGSDATSPELRYCTAKAAKKFFREIQPGRALHEIVSRFELGMPAGHHAAAPSLKVAAPADPGADVEKLTGKVLGLIDGGLAFANARFLRAGRARTRYFWRQDLEGVGPVPVDFGYGHELTAGLINACMDENVHNGLVDESAVYSHFGLSDLRRSVNHGTHVMDIAGGPRGVTAHIAGVPPNLNAPPSWAMADDDASRCDLVAVQLDWPTILDTSGGSMNVQIMDGLMYILARCDASARIAVNISWGTLAGPHDGSSVLEAAMEQLIELRRGSLQIAVPAGNSYQSRCHANGLVRKSEPKALTWCVQADDFTQTFTEIWMAPRSRGTLDGVKLRLTPPGCDPLPWMRIGESGVWTDGGDQPLCALIFPKAVATGTRGTCALLALAPTASFEPGTVVAPSGSWKIEVRNDRETPVIFDAFIERDDIPIGLAGKGGRQSYFTDELYDTSGNPQAFIDWPDNQSLIRRSGNFNSISTGERTVSVGGLRVSDGSWALYSPQEPDPDRRRPSRPRVVKVPDTAAFSDENPALPGLSAAGTRSGGVVRLIGTSGASPQVARRLLNSFKRP